ncbi:hypothetical protein FB567DRAFT_51861 [Paraphoma chrysanthemicola]|uniref:Uncharacterized protein n=1 Tax=Paraphoma chrysanthemicola TaxID=798071 RepID=A0A8K0VYU7_9PLEO|nr:hypothetical protein FB567DRAFT_51861 [Paraphoma chrysanthemicola]
MAAPQTSSLVQHLRQDLLYRLRWDLTRPVEEMEIELATEAQDQTIITPFLDHPLADEPLFDLLRLKCIDEIFISDFAHKLDREFFALEECKYKPPAFLKIDNASKGGSPITFRQFVTDFHAYVGRNMEELKKAKDEVYGEPYTDADGTQGTEIVVGRPVKVREDVKILFDQMRPANRNGVVKLEVLSYAEGEKIPRNDFWGQRLSVARSFDARRKYLLVASLHRNDP